MRIKNFLTFLTLLTLSYACQKEDIVINGNTDLETPDWTDETHGKKADPNYSVVFPQDEVLRFDIVIDQSYWDSLENDLADNIGGSFFGPSGPGGPGGPGETDFDPIWIPCSFNFEGKEWYQVGIRVKGNSSLRSTYQMGIKKFSFKLDFDEFEDNYPAIDNQRFNGFKQLNLNNNFEDLSQMREKVASDLYRDYGLVSAQSAFVALYIDHGEGSQYYGLYTLVEEVDDTVLDTQMGDDDGNLYKPEGNGATFAAGSYNESEMEKKNNEDIADYSDVYALYNTINDDNRSNDTDSWMTDLEQVFDTDTFLKWLAANITMQNWDTYGLMNHNFYLYSNPHSNSLMWIPWDNNEALKFGKMGGSLSLELAEVNEDWPLIRYIIDQPEYSSIYKAYLNQFIADIFTIDKLQTSYQTWANLIEQWVTLEEADYSFLNNASDFSNEVEYLKLHVIERVQAVNQFLEQ